MNAQIAYLIGLASEYIQKSDLTSAERLLKQAQKLDSKNSEVFRLLGVTFAFKREPEAALDFIEKSLKLDSKNWLAHSNKGNLLKELNKPEAALKSFEKAISLQPNYAEAYNNIGNLYQDLNQPEVAIKSFEKAISLQPNYAQAYSNLGNALLKLKLLESALVAYERAMKYGDNSGLILSSYINCKMQLCEWAGMEDLISNLHNLNQNNNIFKFLPFCLLSICDDPHLIRKVTQEYIETSNPSKSDLGAFPLPVRHDKIRIGYYSPDFRNHPVSYLLAGVFESHNKDKFELIGFSMGTQVMDEMRARLAPQFDQLIDISLKSDLEVAQLSRELKIDIAIDLCGLTSGARPSIFAYRAAPIQIGYLGYLSTLSASYMDYIIADKTIIPNELQNCYSEKIIYLPSYQANDDKRKISDKVFTGEELGLPNKGFVFCCFNAAFKITQNIFDSWMRILEAVPESVLFLYVENDRAKNNLIQRMKLKGLNEGRLIFGGVLPYAEYLARYRVADLFLDTSPYNAGTTASDALWADLPVITFMGSSFSSRLGASLLNALDMPELIASSQSDYESLAIRLANDPTKLMEIKDKLKNRRLTAPLFNTKSFTQSLESAYEYIYERYQHGSPPESVYQ